ncbi:MAG: L,D-transpeptidase [Anaerolineae bacterium]|nr:L,D-transpeptidase [Anaerolineae bacterium]
MRRHYSCLLLLCALVPLLLAAFFFNVAPENAVFAQFMTNTPQGASASATRPPAVAATAAVTVTPAATVTPAPTREAIFNAPVCQYVPGQPTAADCIALMQKYPRPDVLDIQPDGYTLSNYTFWKIPQGNISKFDAPGGSVIGTIPPGFNFVRVVNSDVAGWLQIEGGEWIERSAAEYREASYFTGVRLPDGWNQPFGWVLDTTGIWASLEPGGPSTSESGLVPLHYERYNIYAEAVDAEGWKWYLVGPDQWVKQIYMAVVQPTTRPAGLSGSHWIAIDLFEQTLVLYENDRPVFATLISTGLPGTETNEGIFPVWAALARDAMSGSTGAPNAYALQSVPWVMYFDGSISLHGTYWHDTFGYRRSRGCVNLSISDARHVFEWYQSAPADAAGVPQVQVYVHSTGEYRDGDNK